MLKQKISELEEKKSDIIAKMISKKDHELTEKYPKFKAMPFGFFENETFSDLKNLEKFCRESLVEFGLMTVPEVKSFIAEISEAVSKVDVEIASRKKHIKKVTVKIPKVKDEVRNMVLAMVFSQKECRHRCWQ